jgi:hypothetical protein
VHQETTSTSPSPALRLVIRDAEARELDNRISISVDYLPRTSLLCRRHAYGDAVDMGLSANPTLTELLAGVTITNGSDPYPYVRLQAEPVRTVIR